MTTREELDERYGRTRRRRAPWIIGGVVVVLAVAALGWSTVSQSMNSVDADDLGFEVIDEHTVSVDFQVSGVQGKSVFCAVEALDEEFGVVGWKIVEVPVGDTHSRSISETVPTVAEATTGLVNSCWVA
ncbi:DUF4307 domain-containing protein [Microbacterium sp.]|uniref:DUF4307 domain-containing protein n=1 Tax=Microbacterium sp. TaxID=51671 RepID=UPI0028111770|nr:DUF4307 domain-containing protein [Microbacterium sp.]